MKFFSCQPDSHNAFVSLINRTICYFVVEGGCGPPPRPQTPCGGGGGGGETAVRVQRTITLPELFGGSSTCFSTANVSMYHTDLVLVGTGSGLLAVVMMRDCGLVYVPGCSPAALQHAREADRAAGAEGAGRVAETPVWAGPSSSLLPVAAAAGPPPPVPPLGRARATPGSPFLSPASSSATRDAPLRSSSTPELRFVGLPPPARGAAGSSSAIIDGISDADLCSLSVPLPLATPSGCGGQVRVDPATSVTWMRDKPLAFVGRQSGRVEWYYISPPAATGSGAAAGDPKGPPKWRSCRDAGEAADEEVRGVQPAYGVISRPSPSSSSIAWQCEGEGNGIAITLLSRAHYQCGPFYCSDSLPCNGYLVAGARLFTFVFDCEPPYAPVAVVPTGCGYLACHPFLPFVACFSYGPTVGDRDGGASVSRVFEWSHRGPKLGGLRAVLETTLSEHPVAGSYFTGSWKFSSELQLVISNTEEGVLRVVTIHPCDDVDADDLLLEDGAGGSAVRYTSTERRLRIPLHSLINVEYISAATSPLAAPSTVALIAPDPDPDGRGGGGVGSGGGSWAAEMVPGLARGRRAGGGLGNGAFRRKSSAPKENLLAATLMEPAVTYVKAAPHTLESTGASASGGRPGAESGAWAPGRAVAARHRSLRRSGRGGGGGGGGGIPFLSMTHVEPGAGATSSVVGINHAGEITSVLVVSNATATWLSEGDLAIGFCATACIANGDIDGDDTERRMKRRLRCGFGTHAEENARVLRSGADEPDLAVLFSYIAVLEWARIAGPIGDVPGFVALLTMRTPPTLAQLIDIGLLPQPYTVACRSTDCANDPRRLLLLYVLGWLPSADILSLAMQDSGAAAAGVAAAERRGRVVSSQFDHVCLTRDGDASALLFHSREPLERAVAIEIFHDRLFDAATLLSSHAHLHGSYHAVAALLLHHLSPAAASTAAGGANWEASRALPVMGRFFTSLSPILRAAFAHLFAWGDIDFYGSSELEFWDRIAIAILRERDNHRLVALLDGRFADEAVLTQRLLLHGVGEATVPLMQCIVDSTNDFQLGACLFARVAAGAAAAAAAGRRTSTPSSCRWGVSACRTQPMSTLSLVSASSPHPTSGGSVNWERWASAYRTFLDAEQEFVKRAMFCVECKRLFHTASEMMAGSQHTPVGGSSGSGGGIVPAPGSGSSSAAITAAAASATGSAATAATSGPTPGASLAAASLLAGGSGNCSGSGGGSMGYQGAAVGNVGASCMSSPASPGSPTPFPVASSYHGAEHLAPLGVGTGVEEAVAALRPLLQRPLLSALDMLQPVCSVCEGHVRLCGPQSEECFVWCTTCQHGGHVHHLKEWFGAHRKCPRDGCQCRCDDQTSS